MKQEISYGHFESWFYGFRALYPVLVPWARPLTMFMLLFKGWPSSCFKMCNTLTLKILKTLYRLTPAHLPWGGAGIALIDNRLSYRLLQYSWGTESAQDFPKQPSTWLASQGLSRILVTSSQWNSELQYLVSIQIVHSFLSFLPPGKHMVRAAFFGTNPPGKTNFSS